MLDAYFLGLLVGGLNVGSFTRDVNQVLEWDPAVKPLVSLNKKLFLVQVSSCQPRKVRRAISVR